MSAIELAASDFPSPALYPLHDKDGELEFVLGIWFHTRELRGKPTVAEVAETLSHWPAERRQELLQALAKHGQVQA